MQSTIWLLIPILARLLGVLLRWAAVALADGRIESEERMLLVRMMLDEARALTGQTIEVMDTPVATYPAPAGAPVAAVLSTAAARYPAPPDASDD